MKMEQENLKEFVKQFGDFYNFSFLNQVALFGYYVEYVLNKKHFSSKDIRECFQTLPSSLPANLPFMIKVVTEKQKRFVKIGKFFRVTGSEVEKIQKLIKGENAPSQSLTKKEFPSELALHEKIVSVSNDLYFDGYYSPAIFEAVKVLEQEIKKKSGISGMIGTKLINHVFNPKKPILKIVEGNEIENIDERDGFRLILLGIILGVKNPKSHSIQTLKDPAKALEYLSMLSLLLKRIDESIL